MTGASVAARARRHFDLSNLRGDLFGGLTAGVVAPLDQSSDRPIRLRLHVGNCDRVAVVEFQGIGDRRAAAGLPPAHGQHAHLTLRLFADRGG